jgi:hypothetical protein
MHAAIPPVALPLRAYGGSQSVLQMVEMGVRQFVAHR